MKILWVTSITLASVLSAPIANAGILEDLLARPAIQNLLGRLPELQTTVKRCTEAPYRQRNQAACLQAEQAARLAAMPPELRAVLAVPASAGSLRELCLMAQSTPVKSSYMCAELIKADLGFKSLADQQQQRQTEDVQRTRAIGASAESPN